MRAGSRLTGRLQRIDGRADRSTKKTVLRRETGGADVRRDWPGTAQKQRSTGKLCGENKKKKKQKALHKGQVREEEADHRGTDAADLLFLVLSSQTHILLLV
ncbi:hypothetical protein ACFX15_037307 [Malus domestica]